MPVMVWNSSPARWVEVPTPAEAKVRGGGAAPRQLDQVGHVGSRHVLAHNQDVRRNRDLCDRDKIMRGIVGQLGVERGVDDDRSIPPPSSSVAPSGAALATWPAAMLPPAPSMFSTTTGLPHAAVNWSARTRAATSGALPGPKPSTMRMGGLRVARLGMRWSRQPKKRDQGKRRPYHVKSPCEGRRIVQTGRPSVVTPKGDCPPSFSDEQIAIATDRASEISAQSPAPTRHDCGRRSWRKSAWRGI